MSYNTRWAATKLFKMRMKYSKSSVIVVKPKQTFADWAQKVSGHSSHFVDYYRENCNCYLIREVKQEDEDEKLIAEYYAEIFEYELASWAKEELWVEDRTLEVFHEWFDVEIHYIVYDLVGTRNQ